MAAAYACPADSVSVQMWDCTPDNSTVAALAPAAGALHRSLIPKSSPLHRTKRSAITKVTRGLKKRFAS